MTIKDLEIYNYNRENPFINIDVRRNETTINLKNMLIIDKLNTNKFKIKLIRLILNFRLNKR